MIKQSHFAVGLPVNSAVLHSAVPLCNNLSKGWQWPGGSHPSLPGPVMTCDKDWLACIASCVFHAGTSCCLNRAASRVAVGLTNPWPSSWGLQNSVTYISARTKVHFPIHCTVCWAKTTSEGN